MLGAGAVVDRYEVVGLLGEGNMARVYLVRHRALGTEHVLKVLKGASAAGRVRLVREGRVQASLKHPNVVEVTDLVEVDGAPALVMERVDGPSLDRALATGRLPNDPIDALVRGLCAGLAAAHAFGVVHRDLKPANVLLELRGDSVIPRIADFGLVKFADPDEFGAQTATAATMGTPVYMAPEQIRGTRDVDARADIWALGAVLYELATGRRAFSGLTLFAVFEAVTDLRFVPPEQVDPALPSRWVEAIASCLRPVEARAGSVEEVFATWSGGEALGAPSAAVAWPPEVLARLRARAPGPRAGVHPVGGPAIAADARTYAGPVSSVAGGPPPPRKRPDHSLPTERDAFIGRDADLERLAHRLDGGARLVSVLGIGGTGKTRLVTHFGWIHLEEWPGGVWFCDLSEARDVDGIAHAVGRSLDVPLGGGDPVVQLGDAVAGRGRCLVLLDNFEQVTRHASETLGPWLDRAPEASFVVTTRELLGLPGETTLALEPLRTAEAFALFVARASQAKPDFAAEDRASIAALVELLDGLPLAIELAAARARLMPPKALLARMGDRFRLLASPGGRPPRHATLRGALDWSWDLLSADEQAALAQLSVFEGGFTLDAAEGVLAVGERWAVDAVQALVDKSLVRAVADDRFDLLVSVREYAEEKLVDQGGREAAERRHAAWFARFGTDEALDALYTHGGVARSAELTRELDNLVAACRRSVAEGAAERAVALLRPAWEVFAMTGPTAQGLDLAERVAAMPGLEPEAQATAATVRGHALTFTVRFDEARAHFDATLAAARAVGALRAEGEALHQLGVLHLARGRLEEARDHLDAALGVARVNGDRRMERFALRNLGTVHRQQGRMDEAREHLQVALAVARADGDRRFEGVVLGSLGNLHRQLGRVDEAREHYEAALAVHRAVGDRRFEGAVLGSLAILTFEQGRTNEARERFGAALAVARAVGDRRFEGQMLGNLGHLEREQGRMDRAAEYLEAALAVHRAVGDRRSEGIWRGNLGLLHLRQGRMGPAHEHLTAALEVARAVGDRRFLGTWLANLGLLHLQQGRTDEARATLADAERALHAVGDDFERAKLLCTRARLEAHVDHPEDARSALREARDLASRFAAGPEGELGRAIAEAARALGDSDDTSPMDG